MGVSILDGLSLTVGGAVQIWEIYHRISYFNGQIQNRLCFSSSGDV